MSYKIGALTLIGRLCTSCEEQPKNTRQKVSSIFGYSFIEGHSCLGNYVKCAFCCGCEAVKWNQTRAWKCEAHRSNKLGLEYMPPGINPHQSKWITMGSVLLYVLQCSCNKYSVPGEKRKPYALPFCYKWKNTGANSACLRFFDAVQTSSLESTTHHNILYFHMECGLSKHVAT